MHFKDVTMTVEGEGRFSGWASKYDEVDHAGDVVVRGPMTAPIARATAASSFSRITTATRALGWRG